MKRFWGSASIAPEGAGHTLLLDGKPMRLPGGETLLLPFPALAQAVVTEWEAAPSVFTMEDLPLTRLAATAADQLRRTHDAAIQQLAAYGMNDLLCYRAADPELAADQAQAWQPWLDWAEKHLGAALAVTAGVVPIEQLPECRGAFVARLSEMNEYPLAGLAVIVPILGSLVLGLAVQAGALAPAKAVDCANLDELWQEARWGSDAEAQARRADEARDIAAAARFLNLCR